MNRKLQLRAWTGKRMLYQDQQYLASFIRRAVVQIMLDHGMEDYREHESYLPNGGNIDEYLTQWTGLLDKNGKEIYEGDIVRLPERTGYQQELILEVRWDEDRWNVFTAEGKEIYHTSPDEMGGVPWKDFEVIGNVYEHPDLLSH